MHLKKTPNPKGRIRLSIVDGYYDKEKNVPVRKQLNLLAGLTNWKNCMMTLLTIFKNG